MDIRLRILLPILYFYVHSASAQVQHCIDIRPVVETGEFAQGVYDFNNKWTPGTTLRVSFMDGSEWQHEQVKRFAPGWSKYANIRFQFVKLGRGEIRISFSKPGSYCVIGTDAKSRLITEETMNLGWILQTKTETQLKAVILHEFGHALGLLHEHMNPMSKIEWNKPAVYAWYLQYEGWDKKTVDKQVFDRYSVSMTNKQYDSNSIMHYPVPGNFTLNGYVVGENTDLSAQDKKLIAELYPPVKEYSRSEKTVKWTKLQELFVEYGVAENGVKGMRIQQDFFIYNTMNTRCIMAIYFYDAENSMPLADRNGLKASADGNVAAYTYFTPQYESTQYQKLSVFMPYDELELDSGNHRLKFYVAIFDAERNLISSTGYSYFSYGEVPEQRNPNK